MTELYRHYDKDDRLLYVGISLSAAIRLAAHRRKAGWFASIRTIKITRHRSLDRAREEETRAIREEKPLWNIAGTGTPKPLPKRKRRVYRYLLPIVSCSRMREKGRFPRRVGDDVIPRLELYSTKVDEAYQELIAIFSKSNDGEVAS